MLSLRPILSRQSVIEEFLKIDPLRHSWIVSDLRTKFEFQNRLLDRDHFFTDTAVMRISDFWSGLLKQRRPDLHIVSSDFALAQIRRFLREHENQLGLGAQQAAHFFMAMDKFSQIVFHPQGEKLLEDWFIEYPDSKNKWGQDYLISRLLLKSFLNQKMICKSWISALLLQENLEDVNLPKGLFVDLGFRLKMHEAVLLNQIAKDRDVTVLYPSQCADSASEKKFHEYLIRPYELLGSLAKQKVFKQIKQESAVAESKTICQRQFLKFSSSLGEVKHAVALVRQWLEQENVDPSEVVLLAPQIETYWPLLQLYLQIEGIPVQKAITSRLSSYPDVQKWISSLKASRHEITFSDLETVLYELTQSPLLRHEEFSALYSQLYEMNDLKRNHVIANRIAQMQKDPFKNHSRDEFLSLSILFWPLSMLRRGRSQNLTSLIREILKSAPTEIQMPWSEWCRYVESLCSRLEVQNKKEDVPGVIVTNLESAPVAQVQRRIFLGLTDENIRRAERKPIPSQDIYKLAELGFYFELPDSLLEDAELNWVASSSSTLDVYMTSLADFEGKLHTPTAFWVQGQSSPTEHHLQTPARTRWDELQSISQVPERLKIDLGDLPLPSVQKPIPAKLSPSFFKVYQDCPFKSAIAGLFKIKEIEDLDLDLQKNILGQLIHKLFQKATDEDWISQQNISDDFLMAQIHEAKESLNLILGEQLWWDFFAKKILRTLKEFLKVEKEWKKQHPRLKILPSEKAWQIYFDAESGTFSKSSSTSEKTFMISGRIDRFETNQEKQYVVIDYKATQSGHADQKNWLKENDLQLLFYMWAVEKTLLAEDEKVVGAFYYAYKNFKRDLGFKLADHDESLYPHNFKKKMIYATAEEKQELFNQLEKIIHQTVNAESRWQPLPRKIENCPKCKWKNVCRASHLQ